jgi:hypothetical protein
MFDTKVLTDLKKKWMAQSPESREAIVEELSEHANNWSRASGHAETLEDSDSLKIVVEVMKALSDQS